MTDRDSERPFFRTGDAPLIGRVYLLLPCAAPLWFQSNVQDALLMLGEERFWAQWGTVSIADAAAAGATMFSEVQNVIGWIFPYITASAPEGTLPCDGGTYDRVDYPNLYSVLDSALIVDADTFVTPDLRGRTVIGVGSGPGLTPRAFNAQVGEEDHLLIVSETPSHGHTNTPHAHSELPALPNATTIGPGAPQPTAVPGLGSTGLSGVSIDSTGGDGTHNNMQPSLALNYCVVAG